jgi:hypothetical protein
LEQEAHANQYEPDHAKPNAARRNMAGLASQLGIGLI